MLNKNKENIIDVIEDRLRELEMEKNEIEKMYGIDENLINEINLNKDNFIAKDLKDKNIKSKTNFKTTLYNNTNLPKLEVTTKNENKSFYKTPDTLQDSLKYEPNIKDLLDENEFEPSFVNINQMRTNPFIPKGNNLCSYLKVIKEDFIRNYIN